MKIFAFVILSIFYTGAVQAESFKAEFKVESSTGQEHDVQVMVMGISNLDIDKIRSVVLDTVTETAKQYTKNGFLASRDFVINRLERRLKKQNLAFDGIGVLGIIKKGDKIIDVE